MKAADLVVLASAHGIDISHTVASETNTRGAARPRRRTELERHEHREVRETAGGKASRVVRPRHWSHAEAGMAGCDVPRMPWLAVLYSIGGDREHYSELHRGLTLKALDMAEEQHWPWQVRLASGKRDYYLERLAELVLDYDAFRRAFEQDPALFALYMGVTEPTWSNPLFGYFLELQGQYSRWLDVGQGIMARWLREDLPDVEDRRSVRREVPKAARATS